MPKPRRATKRTAQSVATPFASGDVQLRPFLKIADLSRMLSITYLTAYRRVASGEIASVKIGGVYRIDPRTVDAYLKQHAVGAE